MKKILATVTAASATLVANASLAQGLCTDPASGKPIPCNVPEISALEGTAALAAIAAIVLLTWERRRRAA